MSASNENGNCRLCGGPIEIIKTEALMQKVKCSHCGDIYRRETPDPPADDPNDDIDIAHYRK